MRIISLLPSATEIICSVGGAEYLVGITHECDYPAQISHLDVVTDTKIPKGLASEQIDQLVRNQLQTSQALYSLREDVVARLQPDLIVSQSLCDVCAVEADEVDQVLQQLNLHTQVINLAPSTLNDVFDTMLVVGDAIGNLRQAESLVTQLRDRVQTVRDACADQTPTRVAVLEWLHPLFNSGHWTPELVSLAGGVDVLGSPAQPSTTISIEQLLAADPEVLVIALCGFDVERSLQDLRLLEQEPEWEGLQAVANNRVHVLDGNAYFSRPGPRLVDSLEQLVPLLQAKS